MSIQNITPKYQLNILEAFNEYLRQLQYDAELVETEIGDGRSYCTQYVVLNVSSELLPGENYLRVETAFLPQSDNESNSHSILQSLVPILSPEENADIFEIHGLLIKLNTFLPIGSFGYWEEQHMVYFKQNNMVAKQNHDHALAALEEQLAMIQHLLANFIPSIAMVAIDAIPARTALEQNPFTKAFL